MNMEVVGEEDLTEEVEMQRRGRALKRKARTTAAAAVAAAAVAGGGGGGRDDGGGTAPRALNAYKTTLTSYPSSFKHAPSLSLGVQQAWIDFLKNDASRDATFVRVCFDNLQRLWERLEKSVSPADPPLSDTKALGAWLGTPSVWEVFMLHFGKLDRAGKRVLRSGMVGFGLGEIIAAAAAAAKRGAPKITSYPSSFKHAPSLSLGVQQACNEFLKNDAFRDATFVRMCFGTFQCFWERLEKSVSPADPPLSDTKALGAWLETPSVREVFMLHFGKLDANGKRVLRSGMVGFGLGKVVGKVGKKVDMSERAVQLRKNSREKKKKKKQQ